MFTHTIFTCNKIINIFLLIPLLHVTKIIEIFYLPRLFSLVIKVNLICEASAWYRKAYAAQKH